MKALLLLSLTFFPVVCSAQFHTLGMINSQTQQKPDKSNDEVNIREMDEIKSNEKDRPFIVYPPIPGVLVITSPFGRRSNPFNKANTEFHSGLDISAASGTPVFAMLEGIVEKVGYDKRSGNYIRLRHGNFTICYCHLVCKPHFANGSHIQPGDIVAHVGSTGRSTGPHLHISIRHNGTLIDPLPVLSLLGFIQ